MTPETYSPLNILAIENDLADLNLLEDMLWSSPIKLQKIYAARSVQAALRILNEQAIDFVISELSFPDVSGIEVLMQLQQAAYSIPVIILTKNNNNELALGALKVGAQDFLIKEQLTDSLLFKSIQYSLERKRHIKELWESKERFFAVSKATKDAVWDWDIKNNTIWWGEGFKTVFGYEPELSGAETWYDRIHPEDKERVLKAVHDVIAGGGTNWSGEYRFLKADGTYANVFDRGYTIRNDIGETTHMVGSFMDITASKKAENDLRESERRYRALADQAPMFIWIAGEHSEVFFSNKAMLEFLGLSSPTEISGQLWRERVHPDDEAYVLDVFTNAYESRLPYTLECRMKAASGEYRWLFYKGVPYTLEHGRFGGFIGTAIDIHDRKVAEAALLESEERLRLAIESTQIGTWDYFPLTGDLICSVKCKKMFGLPADAEVGYPVFLKALHPEDRDRAKLAIQNILNPESGGLINIDFRTIGIVDKKLRWIHAAGRAFYDHQGITYRFIGTVLDITEQKLARETLEKSAEILEKMVQERTSELQRANENLKKSNAELEQFAYIASHDLQEPLRKILIFSDQLQSNVLTYLPDHAQVWLEKIRYSARRMSILIKDLLEYSRLLNKTDIKLFTPIDLSSLIAHILKDLELVIQQNHATISIEELPVIEAVEVQMRQLFYNLLSNSLKFCAPQRAAEIRIFGAWPSSEELDRFGLSKELEYCKIIISDNGIGFGQEFAEQIFTIFQRLHTKERYPGTGIGLAICRRVVENHGGAIYAQGSEDEGATFNIILPVKPLF